MFLPSVSSRLTPAILASLTLLQSAFSQTLIPTGAFWRYKADGTDQGTLWSQQGFNDSTWQTGRAPLGFGDPHIVTTIGTGSAGIVTFYFRANFVVSNVSSISSLTLRLLRDDGAVVYLNGVEVRRDHMPPGPVAFNTLANVAVSGPEETTYFDSSIPSNLLVEGLNLLAVEVHQSGATSSDLGFDAALIVQTADVTPPTIVSANATYGGPTITVVYSEAVDPIIATDVFDYAAMGSDGSAIGFDNATISSDQRTVTLFVSSFTPLVQGISYTLDVCCMCDTSGNCMPSEPQSFPITFPSDVTPPTFLSASSTYGGSTATAVFNEPVDAATASDFFNYLASGSDGNTVLFNGATLSADQRTVTLSLDPSSPFVQGVSYVLAACCVCDLSGNCIPGTESIPITFPPPPASSTLVARGSVWRYLDTGIDPGPAWFDPFFDDSLWASGPAELGYGDNDEATVINRIDPTTRASLITAYFRQTFNVTDANAIPGLSLHIWRDDGAIVYINGVEVFRNNMPDGPATYSTLANQLAFDDGDIAVSASLTSGVLVNGLNFIAVEVHQQAISSSDISFDLELLAGDVPVNERPVANNQSVIVQFNTATPITLTGGDANGDPLTFTVVTSPGHGTLSGTPPNVTYTPNANFTGPDSFTFKVNDGQLDSTVATVSLDVQPGPLSLILRGSVWRYLDTGIDPGTAWVSLSFDDSSWASGPAELGYGDFNEATVINNVDSSGQRLLTAYFRHTFNVTDASTIGGLSLRLWRDDGAIVYLNGVEVFRNNMPAGPVNYSTLAPTIANDDGNIAVVAALSSSMLVNGANVMAVEVHQQSLQSSDISFDLQLDPSETPANQPPTANNQFLTTFQDTPLGITLTGSDPDGDPLTFMVKNLPSRGTLSGTPPNLTYTPAAGFVGADAFTFTVSDGQFESSNALVRIQVNTPPNPPDIVSAIAACNGMNVAVTFDEPVEPNTSQDPFNYTITDSVGNPLATINATLADPQTVILSVEPPLTPGQSYTLDAFAICDTVGDCSGQLTAPIQFETVPPQVSCNVAVHTLSPVNNQLVNVGLSASSSEGAIQVQVFSDEPEVASLQDAVYANGVLQLRARKSPSSDGRVYLIVVSAADPCGNIGVCCTTVVIPAAPTQAALNAVNAQAAAAQANCSPTGAPSTPHQILP